jgi:ABC-type phosphate/phosphonate transport system substrate-binding protein
MAWVAKSSASGYFVPRLTLAARGIRPDEYFAEESFLHSHGAVVKAVLTGAADAGGTYAVFEEANPTKRLLRSGFGDTHPDLNARVLMSAGPIPADVVVARSDVGAVLRAEVMRAFEAMATTSDTAVIIERIFNAERFERFEPGAFRELVHDVETGRELGLLDEE